MACSVKIAVPQDAPQIVALVRELASGIGEETPITEDYAAAYLRFPGSGALIAEEDGLPVGLLSYSVRPGLFHGANSALIEELVVAAGHRGRGHRPVVAGSGKMTVRQPTS